MLYIDQHNYMMNIIELLLINKIVKKFYAWRFFFIRVKFDVIVIETNSYMPTAPLTILKTVINV